MAMGKWAQGLEVAETLGSNLANSTQVGTVPHHSRRLNNRRNEYSPFARNPGRTVMPLSTFQAPPRFERVFLIIPRHVFVVDAEQRRNVSPQVRRRELPLSIQRQELPNEVNFSISLLMQSDQDDDNFLPRTTYVRHRALEKQRGNSIRESPVPSFGSCVEEFPPERESAIESEPRGRGTICRPCVWSQLDPR